MKRLNVGAIGCGYWGPNLIRNCIEIPEVSLEAVADLDWERLRHIQTRYPGIPLVTDDYTQMFDAGLDAVVVSTPPETHHTIVAACIEQGLHVLVEKPLATTSADARHLIELAERHGRRLMVGHTFEYNPAVRALREVVASGDLGSIHYIDAVRVGLGLFHPTLNVIWDLAPHDVSILIHILGEMPTQVSTRGIACVQRAIEDVAYITLTFPSGILAHVRLSWLDPQKTRRITVVGRKKMIVYDDVEAHEKLKVYDKRVDTIRRTDTFGEFQFAYHYGSVVSPYVHFEEPLRLELLHFAECVT
ncbi:MAG TPA: Gfo/Idh/MocA family oxidoreductase, partial [Euzebyales bacterium]|nr:Gfo/Idh/MocA family oxidoreductase [Euzebyales bacterium]